MDTGGVDGTLEPTSKTGLQPALILGLAAFYSNLLCYQFCYHLAAIDNIKDHYTRLHSQLVTPTNVCVKAFLKTYRKGFPQASASPGIPIRAGHSHG